MAFTLAESSPSPDQLTEKPPDTKVEFSDMTDSPKLEGSLKMKICSANELVEIFKKTDNVLLFDLRSENERANSVAFFRKGTTIHVPKDVAESSADPASFDSKLKLSDRVRFRKRHEFDYLIVFDEESSRDQLMLDQSLLRKICESVIVAAKLQNCPLVLDGGFKNFRNAFPAYVSSSDRRSCPDRDHDEDSESKNVSYPEWERLFGRRTLPVKVLTKEEEAKIAEQGLNDYLEMWSFLGLDLPNKPSKNTNRGASPKVVPRTIFASPYKIQEPIAEKIPPGPLTVEQMQSAIEAHEQGKNLFQSIMNYQAPDKPKEGPPPIDGDFQRKLRETLTHPWQDGNLNVPGRFSNRTDDSGVWQGKSVVQNQEDKLKAAFCKVVNYFDNSNQHDAAECVTVLLEALHEDLNRVKQKIDSTPPSYTEGKSLTDLCKEYCAHLIKKDDSVIRDNFWGLEITVTTCSACSNKIPVMLPISMLTLPLANSTTSCDLSQCLEKFFQVQRIVRMCSKCKVDQELIEHHFLYRLPKFPILQLERFHREHMRSEIQKLTTKVEFSIDKPLNFDKYVIDKATKNYKFTLNAVIKHYGSLRSGHYVAICRKNGKWVEFDDEDVRYVNESSINEKEAYILFYGPQL